MLRPRVVGYLDSMLRDRNRIVRIEEIILPEGSGLINKTVKDINRQVYGGMLLLAVIQSSDQSIEYNPDPSYTFSGGDI